MTKTKKILMLLCLGAVMHSTPAFAVIEIYKVMQYSVRNVQATIEVVENTLALITSVKMSLLQGMIGAIMPRLPATVSLVQPESFAPIIPVKIVSLVKAGDGISQVRRYVEKELRSINPGDVISQRDALNAVNERLNLSATQAIALGKEAAAKLNKAKDENKEMLSLAQDAADQHNKDVQEAAFGIKALENDAASNQLTSHLIETRAQRMMADIQNRTVKKTTDEELSEVAEQAKKMEGAK